MFGLSEDKDILPFPPFCQGYFQLGRNLNYSLFGGTLQSWTECMRFYRFAGDWEGDYLPRPFNLRR